MQWKRTASFIAVAVLAVGVVVACDSPTSSSPDDPIHEVFTNEDFGRARVWYSGHGENVAALNIVIPPDGYQINNDGKLTDDQGEALEDPEDFEDLEGPLVVLQLADLDHDSDTDSFKDSPFAVLDYFSGEEPGDTWAGGTYTALTGFEFELDADEFEDPDDGIVFSPVDDAYFFLDGEVEVQNKADLPDEFNSSGDGSNLKIAGDVTLGEMDPASSDPQPGEAGTLEFTYDGQADFEEE